MPHDEMKEIAALQETQRIQAAEAIARAIMLKAIVPFLTAGQPKRYEISAHRPESMFDTGEEDTWSVTYGVQGHRIGSGGPGHVVELLVEISLTFSSNFDQVLGNKAGCRRDTSSVLIVGPLHDSSTISKLRRLKVTIPFDLMNGRYVIEPADFYEPEKETDSGWEEVAETENSYYVAVPPSIYKAYLGSKEQ